MVKNNLDKRLADLKRSREDHYGSFTSNMNKIASTWSVLLGEELAIDIPAWKVPLMYAAAKIIRCSNNYCNYEDSYDDALAYLVQAHEMQKPLAGPTQDTSQEDWLKGYSKWKKNKK
jgi:hypothetical protein